MSDYDFSMEFRQLNGDLASLRHEVQKLWAIVNSQREVINALQSYATQQSTVTGGLTNTLQNLVNVSDVEATHVLSMSAVIRHHQGMLNDLIAMRTVINAPSSN